RPRARIALITLGVLLGFALSGAAGAGVYFLPAIKTAFSVTGQKTNDGVSAEAPGAGQPFTMLLLGSDDDAKFEKDQRLTQSMILARVDPGSQRVTMLSIPRDLYVPLSSGGTDKIDKAYSMGGATQSIRTVERNFRVRVDHYAWIGLRGLVKLIDRVGGVDLVATNPVLDDFYPADLSGGNPYGFERVAVLPGPQHLDGMRALEYVRSRHGDQRGDFGRSERQQQVLLALRAKAKLLGVADLPEFAGALNDEFTTDMSVTEANQLLPIAGSVPLSNVKQIVLSDPYTTETTAGDQDVVMPNWELIRPLVSQYFPRGAGGG
ncbi:MAG: LCP family protein, partial [Candidatus Dormibacteria bacterium]